MLNLDTYSSLLSTQPIVSLSKTIVLDAETPVTVLYRFLNDGDFVFLEGISEQVKHDRFSYLGLNPYLTITCNDKDFELKYDNGSVENHSGNVYDFLEELLSKYKLDVSDHNIPFQSGVLGNICYEYFTHLEDVELPGKRTIGLPWAKFIVPRTMLVFDNLYNRLTIVENTFSESVTDKELAYDQAQSRLESTLKKILKPLSQEILPLPNDIDPYDEIDHSINVTPEKFEASISTCKDYISAGDIFQIQVSRRASIPYQNDPILLYRYLRNYNPSPLLFYLKFDDYALVGASPEILVNVDNDKMIIRPLAGTRKRYSKEKTEPETCEELVNNEKEIAEHIMLVDLARNDIGRACELGSVAVTELMNTEKYTHVIHMVSEVEGTLRKECTSVDALKYGYPAGTVTGTPKIRAMEIISELEEEQREFYSGGVVFLDFTGDLKSALAIRSIAVKDGVAYTQAAAGIVADSLPEDEFKETKNKMRSCLSAMHQFRTSL